MTNVSNSNVLGNENQPKLYLVTNFSSQKRNKVPETCCVVNDWTKTFQISFSFSSEGDDFGSKKNSSQQKTSQEPPATAAATTTTTTTTPIATTTTKTTTMKNVIVDEAWKRTTTLNVCAKIKELELIWKESVWRESLMVINSLLVKKLCQWNVEDTLSENNFSVTF